MISLRYLFNIFKFITYNFNILLQKVEFKFLNVQYKSMPKIYGRIIKRGRGILQFGVNCMINSNIITNPVGLSTKCFFYVSANAKIYIGNNVGISNSLLYSIHSIIIEDNVMIGGGCQILDNDFHSISYSDRILNGDNNIQSEPIIIRNGAFIGASSIILKGVTIGERSIVAAGSVVVKDIPNDEVWGGNPARFIKRLCLN